MDIVCHCVLLRQTDDQLEKLYELIINIIISEEF